jgi:hypothetical protein
MFGQLPVGDFLGLPPDKKWRTITYFHPQEKFIRYSFI